MQKWRLRNRLRVETLALAGAALARRRSALAAAQPRASTRLLECEPVAFSGLSSLATTKAIARVDVTR
jgi:hypothetical protein